MPPTPTPVRIGIYGGGSFRPNARHGCGLWAAGYESCVTASEATPVVLADRTKEGSLDELLLSVQGVIFAGSDPKSPRAAEEEWICQWCRDHKVPMLAVDLGMLALNTTFGGTLFHDLPRELPEALQHRHPPEPGLRHAINVLRGTGLAQLYGEGEVVVNSEHRKAIDRVARGFTVCARALDGVVEAIESSIDGWFALGVQWQPASSTASGLDIQLFRGLVDVCARRPVRASRPYASAA